MITQELFRKDNSINLNPRSILIEDIVLRTKQSDVVCLKGFFRSIETFNSQHKYYIDGIVEYYIPTNGKKIKFKLIDYRIFCDSLVWKDYQNKMGDYFTINFLPEITRNSVLYSSPDYQIKDKNPLRSTILKNELTVGHIVRKDTPDQLQICIDLISPNMVKKEKLFSLEAKTYSDMRIENYSSNSLSTIGIENLVSIYQNQTASIKRKAKFGHIPYEGLTEFYVLERHWLSYEEFDKIKKELSSNIYKKPQKSHYNNPYWKNLKQHHIHITNNGFESQLGHTLKLID